MIERICPIAEEIRRRGGRLLVTGGYLRDRFLRRESGDLDLEVLGLTPQQLDQVLGRFGEVHRFGVSFAVRELRGVPGQFSLARRDSLAPPGAGLGDEGEEAFDPDLTFADAAKRRDLTINAMGWDPLSGEVLDPLGGRADLEARVLRAADPARFADDPLRGLRVMQMAARFEMEPDPELLEICSRLDLADVPGERLLPEFDKLLLQSEQPSRGLRVLRETGLVRFFPELDALVGVPQEPEWHPEGDVWVHTRMALDVAATLRSDGASSQALMYGVLCHDLGKPATTREIEGRITARGHSFAGIEPTRQLLSRMRAPNALIQRVSALVEHHLAPALLHASHSTPKAYRRLARRLAAVEVSPQLLERVARADHLGRTTTDALQRHFPAGDRFLERMSGLELMEAPPDDVVRASHVLSRGFQPGPRIGEILERCREIQDETGSTDARAILDRALESC